jgi:hypothetical protein
MLAVAAGFTTLALAAIALRYAAYSHLPGVRDVIDRLAALLSNAF